MEILSEEPVSSKRAIHLLKKFKQDTFIEENDPELSKSINLIYQNLMTSSFEITCPGEAQQNNEAAAETAEQVEDVESKPKRKKHHKRATTEE